MLEVVVAHYPNVESKPAPKPASKEPATRADLTSLPGDVVDLIASNLAPQDIAALSSTNHTLHHHLQQGQAREVWKTKLSQHFTKTAAKLPPQPAAKAHANFIAAFEKEYR